MKSTDSDNLLLNCDLTNKVTFSHFKRKYPSNILDKSKSHPYNTLPSQFLYLFVLIIFIFKQYPKQYLVRSSLKSSKTLLLNYKLLFSTFLLKLHFTVLTGINTFSEYRFAFPEFSAYAKTTIHGLKEYHMYQHSIPHSTVLVKEIISQQISK